MQLIHKVLAGGALGLVLIGGVFVATRGSSPATTPQNSPTAPQVKILATQPSQRQPLPQTQPAQADGATSEKLDLSNKTYPEQVTALSEHFGVVIKAFTEHAKAASGNLALLSDEAWKASVSDELNQIKQLTTLARTLTPPEQFTGANKWLTHSADEYDHLIALYTEGLTQGDSGKLDDALKALNNGNSALHQAQQNLDEE